MLPAECTTPLKAHDIRQYKATMIKVYGTSSFGLYPPPPIPPPLSLQPPFQLQRRNVKPDLCRPYWMEICWFMICWFPGRECISARVPLRVWPRACVFVLGLVWTLTHMYAYTRAWTWDTWRVPDCMCACVKRYRGTKFYGGARARMISCMCE